jgi:hypothetical protein
MVDVDVEAEVGVEGGKETHLRQEMMIEQLLAEEKARLPELTETEIEELRREYEKIVEEQGPTETDYSLLSLYMQENQPICPYCNSILTYFNGHLSCEVHKCFELMLPCPIANIADIAWEMKMIADNHKYNRV